MRILLSWLVAHHQKGEMIKLCNEQTSLNYGATVENQNKINELEKQLHDKEMYLDEVNVSLSNRVSELQETIRILQQEVDMIKFRERHG